MIRCGMEVNANKSSEFLDRILEHLLQNLMGALMEGASEELEVSDLPHITLGGDGRLSRSRSFHTQATCM